MLSPELGEWPGVMKEFIAASGLLLLLLLRLCAGVSATDVITTLDVVMNVLNFTGKASPWVLAHCGL